MRGLYLLSVAVHLLAAAWWIGGLLFLATGVVPVIRRPFFQAVSTEFMRQVGLQFRRLGWIALGLLVLSGLVNLLGRGVTPDRLLQPAFWSGPFGRALAGKLAAVALIFLFNALHDFWAGPR
ncbi:CopD family protein, partial [Thermoflexus sp.]|uniref:CopD family protein n=1 Tax=Thermoflexus sp. TaxID=1969742 RepID=UPI00332C8CD1